MVDKDLEIGKRVKIIGCSSVRNEIGTVIRVNPGGPEDLRVTVQLEDTRYEGENPNWVMRPSELELLIDSDDEAYDEAGSWGHVVCSICHKFCNSEDAHLHQGEWIGDECCWDDRLKSSE